MRFKTQIVLGLGFILGYGLCLCVNREKQIPHGAQHNPAFALIKDLANPGKSSSGGSKTPDYKLPNEISGSNNGEAVAFSPIPASLLFRVANGVFEAGGGLRKQVAKEFGLDAAQCGKVNAALMKARQRMFETMCEQGSVKKVADGQVINIPRLANSQAIIDGLVEELESECGATVARSLVDIASTSAYYLAFGRFKVNVSIEEEEEPEMRKIYPYRLRYEYFSGDDSKPFNAQGFPLNEAEYMRSFGSILRK